MNNNLYQKHSISLLNDEKTCRKLQLNFLRNKDQDQTENLDREGENFSYELCKYLYWNPPEFSLLYGTKLWEGATEDQKILLNQLYWVAYYSQIISAEIATIFYNQTSAAGLFGLEDFRMVCDTLDLESTQERAHIYTFKKVSETVEDKLFGERLFTFPMRGPYEETMIFGTSPLIKRFWRTIQLKAFGLLSSGNAFIGCQYFTVRGLRTLNGKIIQHQLSSFYSKDPNKENAPAPSKISFYHFCDESYHFNSSNIISHDVLKSLHRPTKFEKLVANLALRGCQKDHYPFSTAVNGIFWDDPSLFATVYKLLRSPHFAFNPKDAKKMIGEIFTKESDGLHLAYKTHSTSVESYKTYLADLEYVDKTNKEMTIMSSNSIEKYLQHTNSYFKKTDFEELERGRSQNFISREPVSGYSAS